MRALVLELISHNKAEQLAQTNVERQKRVSRPLFTQMQEAYVLLLILNRMLLVIARSICHTATCTILSAIARLPSIEYSLQEATYLSKGRTVVYPVVPELASSFNWCGSQNLVVQSVRSYQPSHSVHHILQETSLLECFFV